MYTKYNHLCCASTVLIWFILFGDVSSSSPENRPTMCVRLKNVVTYQGAICNPISSTDRDFTQESIDNCKGDFKATCPEFNQAECKWYKWSYPELNISKEIPCCRLKYYERYTWVEIYYTNQYGHWMQPLYPDTIKGNGTNYKIPVYDIVEIHRKFKRFGPFGVRSNQSGFPKNVQNYKEERGLDWVVPSTLNSPLLPDITHSPLLCSNSTDDRCTKDVYKYLLTNYHDGSFDDSKMPKSGTFEGSVSFELKAYCYDILVDGKKAPACRVQYTRVAKEKVNFFKAHHRYTFLEVQVYNNPSISNKLTLKYGYWFCEDPNDRNDLY